LKDKKKITINDIAKKAGVSKTAVSFAMNDPSKISKKTCEKIMRISSNLGYIPNPAARILTTKKTGTIGLLLPQNIEVSMKNPFLSHILQGIGSVCVDEGYSIMIVSPAKGNINKYVRNAVVDGFVAIGLEQYMEPFQILKDRNISFVCIDAASPSDIPTVNSDDETGAYNIMKHIIGLGHKNISILSFIPALQFKEKELSLIKNFRLAGYNKAIDENGMNKTAFSIEVHECECSYESGYRQAEKILTKTGRPTAIIAMADITAVGIISYCKDNGIKVPDQVSVCGFDDILESSIVTPALTTVRQPVYEKGKKAAQLLIDQIHGKKIAMHTVFNTELIVRNSTGRIKT
jgi:alanine racemase